MFEVFSNLIFELFSNLLQVVSFSNHLEEARMSL